MRTARCCRWRLRMWLNLWGCSRSASVVYLLSRYWIRLQLMPLTANPKLERLPMPKLAGTSRRRQDENPAPWPSWGNPNVQVPAGGGEAGATGSFFVGASPAGHRIAWLRCRAPERGGRGRGTECSTDRTAGQTRPGRCVGLSHQTTAKPRRSRAEGGLVKYDQTEVVGDRSYDAANTGRWISLKTGLRPLLSTRSCPDPPIGGN